MITPEEIWETAGLPARRLAGLALNPAAPEDVLLRLLADGPPAARMVLCRDRALPDAVVDAVVRHPDRYTRSFLARSPHAEPAQRARLLDDTEWFVRAHLAETPRMPWSVRPRPLPDQAVVHMILTYEGELLGTLYRQASAGLMESMHAHPEPKVRRMGVAWRGVPDEIRDVLLADPDEEVRDMVRQHLRHEDPAWVERELPDRSCHGRTHALMHCALSRGVVEGVLNAPVGEGDRRMIAGNPTLPADVVVLLAADADPEVRERIAYRCDLGAEERRALAVDADPRVRLALSVHPALSEAERVAIDYEVPVGGTFGPVLQRLWPRDPAAVRRDALSGHPLLRRRAAGDHSLPSDLVARLAADDDLGVRVLLAQNHPEAPTELLLSAFLEYTGYERELLLTRPRFPTAGLARYARHEDPAVRALAARDPATAAETVDRLTHDPDPGVRAAGAGHPNLSPARLAELLDDEELAHRAAANPALEPAVMRRLVAPLPLPADAAG
ncbi:hypothetical protein PV341_26580 [Streptomyces sp. PA03-1a]|nr:hypothetical protein [Streptomyces sp. PA03-1a]MDX2814897.1 hypothetical protein [Streptomyces sp. PA03-5A]